MAGIDQRWLDELNARSDIVSVVSQYVTLNSKGRNYWGLCPFHNEKTPSFSVSPQKGIYYCFGCHSGGNAIHFIMEVEHLPYIEAVKLLAGKVNMELPAFSDDKQHQERKKIRARLGQANRDAARFFHAALTSEKAAIAREYILKRGLSQNTIVKFGLGYAPESWNDLTNHLRELGYSEAELVAANLANTKSDRVYDTFRDRILFPIIDAQQVVIGFGARAMGDVQPKYLNTGDTELFNKRYNLYGINLLKNQRLEDIVIVEGYMDVVSLAQYGVSNSVATLGTALTTQQARLLKRYASIVYLCYDGDSAGQKATERGIDILNEQQLIVKVIRIPNKLDPDEYVKLYGQEGFAKLKESALSIEDYKLLCIFERHNLEEVLEREACAKEACKYIAQLSPIVQERYILQLARKTGYPMDALKREIAINPENREVSKNTFSNFRNTRSNKVTDVEPKRLLKEQVLLKLALEHSEFLENITQALFVCEQHKQVLAILQENVEQSTAAILGMLDGDLAAVAAAALALPDSQNDALSCTQAMLAIQTFTLQDEKSALQFEAEQDTTSLERKTEITLRVKEVNAQLKEINLRNSN